MLDTAQIRMFEVWVIEIENVLVRKKYDNLTTRIARKQNGFGDRTDRYAVCAIRFIRIESSDVQCARAPRAQRVHYAPRLPPKCAQRTRVRSAVLCECATLKAADLSQPVCLSRSLWCDTVILHYICFGVLWLLLFH